MKLIADTGDVKVYRLPANAVNIELNIKSRQIDVVCADSDTYQVEEAGQWVKITTKRSVKKDGSEWSGVDCV